MNLRFRFVHSCRFVLVAAFSAIAFAQPAATPPAAASATPAAPSEDYVKAHYTKYEYRIPMRDGKRLFTSVYVPKDATQTWPIMMDRTPYSVGPYGEDRNPQTFCDIPNAKPEDFKKATEQVFRSKAAPSGVEVLVLPQP